MAKIQCPHCGAVNQDVTLNDPCWQCGTVLGAPVSSIDTGVGAPSSEANPANATGSSSAPIQREIEGNHPVDTRPGLSSSTVFWIAIGGTVFGIIVIALLFWLKVFHVGGQ